MSVTIARNHLERATRRLEQAVSTESAPELIGLAELAKGDIAAAVKETKNDSTSPGGKRKDKVKGQKDLAFTPKGETTHTVAGDGTVVELNAGERSRVSDELPSEQELDNDADDPAPD